jgi:GGDEF domain-containing protein
LRNSEIEFLSDGVNDSLTDALAPARFHEYLTGELSMANRERRTITLISLRLASISLRLASPASPGDSMRSAPYDSAEKIHHELKILSSDIRRLLRGGDQIGRISEDGFWILIRGDLNAAEIASHRFMREVGESTWREKWRVRYCESEVGEEIKSLLRRMDQIHFTK